MGLSFSKKPFFNQPLVAICYTGFQGYDLVFQFPHRFFAGIASVFPGSNSRKFRSDRRHFPRKYRESSHQSPEELEQPGRSRLRSLRLSQDPRDFRKKVSSRNNKTQTASTFSQRERMNKSIKQRPGLHKFPVLYWRGIKVRYRIPWARGPFPLLRP